MSSRKRVCSNSALRELSEKKRKLELPLLKDFYKEVRSVQKAQLDEELDLSNPPSVIHGLRAVLRGYQAQALSWMLFREGVVGSGQAEGQQEFSGCNSPQ